MKEFVAADSVAWTKARTPATVEGRPVTHFGMDRAMHRYYRTDDGALYQFQRDVWVRLTPLIPFDAI